MGKKKKENIRIIREDFNKDYTFVRDNILKNVHNIEDNESATTTTTTTNNEIKFGNKSKEIIEKKKIHFKKVDNKGRKMLGKSLQGHSPIYE